LPEGDYSANMLNPVLNASLNKLSQWTESMTFCSGLALIHFGVMAYKLPMVLRRWTLLCRPC